MLCLLITSLESCLRTGSGSHAAIGLYQVKRSLNALWFYVQYLCERFNSLKGWLWAQGRGCATFPPLKALGQKKSVRRPLSTPRRAALHPSTRGQESGFAGMEHTRHLGRARHAETPTLWISRPSAQLWDSREVLCLNVETFFSFVVPELSEVKLFLYSQKLSAGTEV